MRYEAVVLGNATIWCVSILLVAVVLQKTAYFVPIVAALCIAGLISIVLVSMSGKPEKSKEWYEGD